MALPRVVMAEKDWSENATSTAATPNRIATTSTAERTQPTFVDQSQSRLMTLPKELRNRIYEFVLCDNNLTYVYEPYAYKWEDVSADGSTTKTETEKAYLPRLVPLHQITPPSKDCLLPCRQLYAEMKQMHTAAYRAYWTTNRFFYDINGPSSRDTSACPLLVETNVAQIREFLPVLYHDHHLRMVCKGSTYTFWLLSDNVDSTAVEEPGVMWRLSRTGPWQCIGSFLTIWVSFPDRWSCTAVRDVLAAVSRLEAVEGEGWDLDQLARDLS